ncbi:hypothetical protein [Streptomyces sp. NPDC059009]|uniref:hypothetical protein n=1 Tax=Streptomyces sp. NPDC059009 TaxID=3346694 RepID=UPI0036879AEC
MTYLSAEGCVAFFRGLAAARAVGARPVFTHADDRARSTMRRIGLDRALRSSGGEIV